LKRRNGNIIVLGDMVMKENWPDRKLTDQVLSNGWLYTGGIGYGDEDGFTYLGGREGDIINVGSLKVSPVEVEDVLSQHESVEAYACLGIPDPNGIIGEAAKEFVLPMESTLSKLDHSDLVEYLKGKLCPYKIPVVFELIHTLSITGRNQPV
jgi:acyl-CoA synthetase (AMP-forming)/AMP-acid ligase II